MKQRLPLLLGVFVVMALSNAVVPVLPSLAEGTALQGAIYSAYFFGAMLTVIPAGILSDRIGRVPLLRAGLVLTLLSGALILAISDPVALPAIRAVEGVAAGLFVPAAMSWINLQPDHERMSGNFIAALNLGLVSGLVLSGWLTVPVGVLGGVIVFTTFTAVPLLMTVFVGETAGPGRGRADLLGVGRENFWLYISAIVLVGATGVVTTLYPDFSGESAANLGVQLGLMNVATIVASLTASRFHLAPIPTIRVSAVLMAAAVALSFFTPAAFVFIGGIAGVVMIAQINYLAANPGQQGAIMGLFNASSYAGMTLLPFAAGVVAEVESFSAAFAVTAILAALMAVTIGRCRCYLES
ncbi:MFS transporter [Methanofollis tationis]|uniref:MFS transporter n=1 Tax=Methanofollis tationis TaxID=81417 RepID=A0A7K4HMA0_9EURY|nr:MFS transporter [Methanofollis tationis]NVO66187.1 MFS transporter [Methanofollis tationis]